jgi:hypothetical protein
VAKNEATLLLRIKQLGGEILDRFVITLGDVMDVMKKIPQAVMAAVNAYREEELAINKLTQSMINQGVFTGELRTEYLEMAGALQKITTFSDDQIIAAQGLLQAHIGNKKITTELMTATLDLAAAKGIDLSSAAEMVGKTIGTETDALKRQGVVVKESTDANEKLANVVDALNDKFGGQAAASAQGLGAMDQLKNAWSDFLENTGRLLSPLIIKLSQATTGVLNFFNSMSGIDTKNMSFSDITEEIIKLRVKILELNDNAALRGGLNAGDQAVIASLQKRIDAFTIAKEKIREQEIQAGENARAIQAENADKEAILRMEKDQARAQYESDIRLAELATGDIHSTQVLSAKMKLLDSQIAAETDFHKKRQLLKQRADLQEQVMEAQKNEIMKKNRADTLSTIATMQTSSNKTLAMIGKAAALTQIAIETPVAISKALSAFPPPINFIAAGAVGAAMAVQAARVTGIALAEGGIVRATPGGIQATIGEGGKDEAVIPLDDPAAQARLGGGGGNTIIFNGPVLGDESQAMDFARAIDRSLLKLRQSNQSVAFETDIS